MPDEIRLNRTKYLFLNFSWAPFAHVYCFNGARTFEKDLG